jgi:hypothetical protein
MGQRLPQNTDFTSRGTQESGEKSEEGRLAGAVRTRDCEDLSALDSEIYAVENPNSAEGALESANFEQR